MNGAESLVDTLLGSGIDTCFGNPGTSEMHLVAALAGRPQIRCILGLFEGVVTGAADGFARMAGKPAMTLLHCGAGLANGVANLHNARRANSMVVNCVGDLASYFRPLDSPLASDIEGIARPVSHWVHMTSDSTTVGADAARAVMEARIVPGRIATLIVPSDVSWGEGGVRGEPQSPPLPERVSDSALAEAVRILRCGEPVGLVIGGPALRQEGLRAIAAIAGATGAIPLAPQTIARMERGVGLPAIDRIPVPAAAAREKLAAFRHLMVIGTTMPVGFFAYRGLPHQLIPEGCTVHLLCAPDRDVLHTVQTLADLLDAKPPSSLTSRTRREAATGAVTPESLARSASALMPAAAIVVDESIVVGRALFSETIDAARHDWLQTTGGAIGDGMPLAIGAAVACPGRRVVNFQADGSAMYTVQALWTQAHERLDVTTIILSNRSYAVLHQELNRAGVVPTPASRALLDLDNPTIDWVAIARGMGVEAASADSMERFNDLFERANRSSGPFLIELHC